MDEENAELDAIIESIMTDAYGEDEQLWAFLQAFRDGCELPADALLMGERVAVTEVTYDGDSRRGLTVEVRKADGRSYTGAVWQLEFPRTTPEWLLVAAYRRWLGLEPFPARWAPPPEEDEALELDLDVPIELLVLGVRRQAARCRVLPGGHELTLRSGGVWDLVPGQVITVQGRKQWTHARHEYLSGDIVARRVDLDAAGLGPLQLTSPWEWDPDTHYWGEEEELPDWAVPIVERGVRTSYELQNILPGDDPLGWDTGPIRRAINQRNTGDSEGARRMLMDLLIEDLRCLDAHAHLGNFAFDHQPELALRHYEMGVRIGDEALGPDFDGVLPWGRIDNRPFLRCLHGYGLCLWRLQRAEEAGEVFERMLWLNPSDNQGARFLLYDVRRGRDWSPAGEEA